MTRGLTRAQLGVTDALIEAYGDIVFSLSNNMQTRRGDPVREKDFDAIERHRHELGLSDAQIAQRIGLKPAQVTLIRNLEERRRFRRGHYHMLNRLGGGRRFRAERMTPFTDHFRYSDEALSMRAQLGFDPERVRSYVQAGYWRSDTLSGYLRSHAEARPEAPAIIDAEGRLNYGDLRARVTRLAAGLHRAGVGPGDVVAVQLPNIREYVESFLAIATLGAVMTTLYLPYRGAELSAQLKHAKACALIAMSRIGEFEPVAWALGQSDALEHLRIVITVDAPVKGALSYAELAASEAKLPDGWSEPTAADPFLLLYTSGTTSSPKGVPLNSHLMLTNARLGLGEHDVRPDDILLSAAPFGHLFGLYSVHLAFAAGAAVLLLPQFRPPDLMDVITEHRPTHLFAGPAHLSACLGAGLIDAGSLASLRLIILSGAAIPEDLVHTLDATLENGSICQLWGMTELQAGLYTRPGDAAELVARSAGRPSPGTEVRITDENGNQVAYGEDGELQVRGPSVFAGYYDNVEATAAAFTADGWFRSGDIASMDKNGNVSLSGRLKDVINRGGVKYNPQEIEILVERMPAVMQCAIAPVPDSTLGERACCYVVLKPGQSLQLEDVCGFLLQHGIAKYKLPEQLEVLGEMPMTATRKVIKARLMATSEAARGRS